MMMMIIMSAKLWWCLNYFGLRACTGNNNLMDERIAPIKRGARRIINGTPPLHALEMVVMMYMVIIIGTMG